MMQDTTQAHDDKMYPPNANPQAPYGGNPDPSYGGNPNPPYNGAPNVQYIAEQPAPVNTAGASGGANINMGYLMTWQGVLKIAKCVILLCCLICSAILVSTANKLNVSINSWSYCLAISVIGGVAEAAIFLAYMLGFNNSWATNQNCNVIFLIYHSLMTIMMMAASVIMDIQYHESLAYNAFAVMAVAAFTLEAYFSLAWVRGGTELVALG